MATESDRESADDPGTSAAAPKRGRFWQFSMRQLLFLLAVCGVLLALVAPASPLVHPFFSAAPNISAITSSSGASSTLTSSIVW